MKNLWMLLLFLMLTSGCSKTSDMRVWTSGSDTVEAKFVGMTEYGQEVILENKEGEQAAIPLTQLSQKDQNWVKEHSPSADNSFSKFAKAKKSEPSKSENVVSRKALPAVKKSDTPQSDPPAVKKSDTPQSGPPAVKKSDTPQSGPPAVEKSDIPQSGPPTVEKKTVTIKGINYTFCWCPPGTFMMGSPESEKERDNDETQHKVTLTKGFWLLEHEVTQKMWKSIMGENPSDFKGDTLPVEKVSWDDCKEFIKKLQGEAPEGMEFRLPTEAEWEYACRAGTTTVFSFGNSLNGDKANCDGNKLYGTNTKGPSLKITTPVMTHAPNPWGVYDMHGNVLEWCEDWYGVYPNGNVTDPKGPDSGSYRVCRGGCCLYYAGYCRSAYRLRLNPVIRNYFLGFRLALSSTR